MFYVRNRCVSDFFKRGSKLGLEHDDYRLLEMHVLLRLQHIGLRDVLDILILACVFFLLFKFIINRRAAKLALGLLFIVVIMFFSRYFDMKAMSFISKTLHRREL